MERTLCTGLLRHTLANVALVCSSLGARYHFGPVVITAVSYAIERGRLTFPLCGVLFDGDQKFSLYLEGELLKWGLREIGRNESTIRSGKGASLSIGAPLGTMN